MTGRKDNKNCSAATVHWSGNHSVSHNSLRVSQRTDRVQLMSLYEQARQIGSIEIWRFCKPEELPQPQPARISDSHPAVVGAAAFMSHIGKQYAAGKIELNQIYDEINTGKKDLIWKKCPVQACPISDIKFTF